MKKFIVLLILALGISFTSFGQSTIMKDFQTGPDSLMVDEGTLTIYSPYLDGYWDYSIQIESTFGGSTGDSTNFTVQTYQSNDPSPGPWLIIAAEGDTLEVIVDESSVIIDITDFQGLWLKHILTSHSQDTMLIESFTVLKQKRTRFF
ncbi:MAG: hypothetical protein P9M03_06040 [Candidatus Theseobacter exili]|nr:hypothetical protein [Candidatus Theseobacter exili]